MTYEFYRYIFIGFAALTALMLLVTILLFIRLKIPKVIGDITGRTARKALGQIRETNICSGDKGYRPRTEKLTGADATEVLDKAFEVEFDITYIHTDIIV